jgi:adenine-specific DNA-methyltransferase
LSDTVHRFTSNARWFTTVHRENEERCYTNGYKAIRCYLLMTTDPGGLVFDPTCGSGTTAYAAEQWVRRWTPETPRASRSSSPASG